MTGRDDESPARRVDVGDLTQRNVRAIERLTSIERDRRGRLDRMVDRVSAFAGTTSFLAFNVLVFAGWIAYNTWPGIEPFDPFPFIFLTLVVSLEAIILSTFILISQTRQARIQERRNQLDLQIDLLTEQESTKMLTLLEAIAEKVGADHGRDPQLAALEQRTGLETLAQQIEAAKRK